MDSSLVPCTSLGCSWVARSRCPMATETSGVAGCVDPGSGAITQVSCVGLVSVYSCKAVRKSGSRLILLLPKEVAVVTYASQA